MPMMFTMAPRCRSIIPFRTASIAWTCGKYFEFIP